MKLRFILPLVMLMTACTSAPRTLVAYFSLSGPTYTPDGIVSLEKGNTQAFAEKIAEYTGATLFRIETEKPYTGDFEAICAIADDEKNNNARPALKADLDIDGYDTIYLGWPCWCGTMPMCVLTFLEAHDFSGKTIIPFTTHGGSGFGDSLDDLRKACPDATITEGMELPGHLVLSSDEAIKEFASRKR